MGRRTVILLLILCMITCVVLPASATRLVKRSIEDLAIRSTLVLTGKVTQIQSRWNDAHNQIYTFVTVEVESFLKGSHKEESVVIKQLGGVVGDTAMTVFGTPSFTEEERVLLFLKPEPGTTDEIVVTGLAQGKFHLETDSVTGRIDAENEFEGKLPLSSIDSRIRRLFER